MIRRLGSFILMFGVLTAPLMATDKNVGTSAAQFLKIGAGARPTAMGNAYVAVSDDVNACYFNPAGLSNISNPELTGMHTQYFQGMNYEYGAFVYPTDTGAFALSAATLQADDLQKRSADESYQGTFKAMDAAYALSYAKNVSPLLSFGLTGRYIRQEIDTANAATWSSDVGVMKRFVGSPLRLGLAVKHVGPQIKFQSEGDPQPLIIDAGASYLFFRERLLIASDLRKPRDNKIQYGIGSEWRQTFSQDFSMALRLGYSSANKDVPDANGLSLGTGLGFRRFQFDFAWVPFGVLGNTFRYAATVRF